MKPLTETRSMRFVVAAYSARRTTPAAVEPSPDTVESVRRTRLLNSLSTCMVRKAIEARRALGKGMSMVLHGWVST